MITVRLKGGMGNQMFQYAFAKAFSLRNKVDFQLDLRFLNDRTPRKGFVFRNYDLDIFKVRPTFYKLEKYALPYQIFSVLAEDKLRRLLSSNATLNAGRYYEKGFAYNGSVWDSKASYFDGYFQSYKYFETCDNDIRKDFNFRQPLEATAEAMLQNIRSCNSICLNVRRGDFVTGQSVQVMPSSYHYSAVEYVKSKISDGHIFVFSDEIDWCIENLSFPLPTTFVTHEFAGSKFRGYLELMMNCNHFIIPNSSFAWWAAFLAKNKGKIVIAPKNWFQVAGLDSSDLIPGEWIRL